VAPPGTLRTHLPDRNPSHKRPPRRKILATLNPAPARRRDGRGATAVPRTAAIMDTPTLPATPAPVPSLPAPHPPAPDLSRIAQDLQIRKVQVESVVQLLDEGNTGPLITRYRKERTRGLNEQRIRRI